MGPEGRWEAPVRNQVALFKLDQARKDARVRRTLDFLELALKATVVVIAFLILIGGLGCAQPQTLVVPAPPPARIARPALRVTDLPPTATEVEVLNAYVLDLVDQVGYADALEILLWGPKEDTNGTP